MKPKELELRAKQIGVLAGRVETLGFRIELDDIGAVEAGLEASAIAGELETVSAMLGILENTENCRCGGSKTTERGVHNPSTNPTESTVSGEEAHKPACGHVWVSFKPLYAERCQYCGEVRIGVATNAAP